MHESGSRFGGGGGRKSTPSKKKKKVLTYMLKVGKLACASMLCVVKKKNAMPERVSDGVVCDYSAGQ